MNPENSANDGQKLLLLLQSQVLSMDLFSLFYFFCKESTFCPRSDVCDQHVVCKMVGQTAECFDRRKTGEVLK